MQAPQTLYRVSQSFTMIIYNFMVCRMCYIYAQIMSEQPRRNKCRLALAEFMSRRQVLMIVGYFTVANLYYLTSYLVYEEPFKPGEHKDD